MSSHPVRTLLSMPEPTLGQRLDRLLLALQLAPQGSAIDYSREVVSSSPDKKTEPAPVDVTALQWAEQARQLVEVGERYRAGEPWRPTMSLTALKAAVRPYAGHASGFVAYALGQPVDRVTQARTVLGVDPQTGLAKPKPLTSRELSA